MSWDVAGALLIGRPSARSRLACHPVPERRTNRIDRIDVDLCLLELKPILPPDVYTTLEDAAFEPLRDALKELYEEWL